MKVNCTACYHVALLTPARRACSNAYYRSDPFRAMLEAYYLQRNRFEGIAERKLRRREVARTAMPRSRLTFAKSLGGDRTRECLKSTQPV